MSNQARAVWILEDDPAIAHATTKELRRAGLRAEWFKTIAETRQGLSMERAEPPVAFLLDLSLPDGDGERVVPEIRSAFPTCTIVAVSGQRDSERILALLAQGVPTISKPVEASALVRWVQGIATTRRAAASSVRLPAEEGEPVELATAQFTPREQTVLAHLMRGASNKEIADALGRSLKTVEFHVSNILRKTRAGSRLRLMSNLGRSP